MSVVGVVTGVPAPGALVLTLEIVLPEPEQIDLRWRGESTEQYRPLATWSELDLLIMQIGQPRFGFLIVESPARRRFVQAVGDAEAMIVEVCADVGLYHPDVWRLRRISGVLAHATLDAGLFDGGMDARCLFTATEAAALFHEWLRLGTVTGVELERVVY